MAADWGDKREPWGFLDWDGDDSQWHTGHAAGGACKDCEE